MRRIYYDCMAFAARCAALLVDLVGADHVLIGSDYPFDMGPANPVAEATENPLLSADEKRQIAGGTAAAIFGLDAEGRAPELTGLTRDAFQGLRLQARRD